MGLWLTSECDASLGACTTRGTLEHMLSHHVTIRMPDELRETLSRRAKDLGADVTGLARRYIEEGLLMDRFPGIRFWQRPGGRQAMLVGHRLSVADVIETYRAEDGDAERTAEYFRLPAGLVEQALQYYAERQGEIDQEIRDKLELAEREFAAWERRQQVAAR